MGGLWYGIKLTKANRQEEERMTENRIKAAVIGAFVADALSLGVHWVYNTGVIDKKFGRVEHYHDRQGVLSRYTRKASGRRRPLSLEWAPGRRRV